MQLPFPFRMSARQTRDIGFQPPPRTLPFQPQFRGQMFLPRSRDIPLQSLAKDAPVRPQAKDTEAQPQASGSRARPQGRGIEAHQQPRDIEALPEGRDIEAHQQPRDIEALPEGRDIEAQRKPRGRRGHTPPPESNKRTLGPQMKFFFKLKSWMGPNGVVILTVLGVIIGCISGGTLRLSNPPKHIVEFIFFPGELFIRMLSMLVLPLIVSSVVVGAAGIDLKTLSAVGFGALLYFLGTSFLASLTGIIIVSIIQPGSIRMTSTGRGRRNSTSISTMDALLDIARNMVPENLIQACFQQTKTVYSGPLMPMNITGPEGVEDPITMEVEKTLEMIGGTNLLGLIIFFMAFGIILRRMGERGKTMFEFFTIMNEVTMQMGGLIFCYSPFGIMCLITGKILKVKDLNKTMGQLGMYVITVVAGLTVHSFISLPLIYFVVTRQNPFVFCKGMLQAWLTALGTASSSATLPVTFKCLEKNNKIDKRVTRVVLPVGATVNMDGTALYEAVAAIFIAQMNGVELGVVDIITVSFTATLASIGAASIPSATLITMLLVLSSLNLPTTDVPLLFTVDWLLDRLRTSVNVLGDGYGAGIVNHLCKDELKRMDDLRRTSIATNQSEEPHETTMPSPIQSPIVSPISSPTPTPPEEIIPKMFESRRRSSIPNLTLLIPPPGHEGTDRIQMSNRRLPILRYCQETHI